MINKGNRGCWWAIVLVLVQAGVAHADGYRNPPPTAEGIAKSGANSVFASDASAIAYNPANLAGQTNASVVVSPTLARSKNTYENAYTGASVESDDPWQVLPNLFVSVPVSEKVSAGLGITTPYGQSIKWNSMDVYNGYAPASLYKAKIGMIDVNPTMSFKLGDSLSVGAGADIYYSKLKFNALLAAPPLPVPPAPPASPAAGAKAEGEDWSLGGNLGITYRVTARQRATLTYRSGVDMDYKGDFDMNGARVGDFATKVKYPDIVGVGYGVQATDDIQIEALVEWLGWSVNDVQTVNAGPLGTISQPNKWEDTITAAIGGSWRFAEGWVFRAGYSFIQSPIPDGTITPILPDTDRHVVGFGLGYSVEGHSIDLSYVLSFYEDRTSTNPAYPGDYEIDSDLVGVTYSYSF